MSTIKVRTKVIGDVTTVRMLITHPMETGRAKDPSSHELIPVHFIQRLTVEHAGTLVADLTLSTAVSRDPYIAVQFTGGKLGDPIKIAWRDNLDQHDELETTIT